MECPDIPVFGYYTEWWNVLHELGHYAVKKKAYINLWRRHNTKDREVPSFNWFDLSYEAWQNEQITTVSGAVENYDLDKPEDDNRYFELLSKGLELVRNDVLEHIDSKKEEEVKFQSTPGEWGVCLWCIRALEVKGWINPMDCREWQSSDFRNNRDPNQWKLKPYQKQAAASQLQRAGIDFSRGDFRYFRPTKLSLGMRIAIALGELDAIYGKDFRVMNTLNERYQIQLQHGLIADQLKSQIDNLERWQLWMNSGILVLPVRS